MKLSIEYFVLNLVIGFFMIFMIQISGVIFKMHQSHQYLDYITHLINNYDGQMELIEAQLNSQTICQSCGYKIISNQQQFEIEVSVPIKLPILDIEKEWNLKSLSLNPNN